MAAACCLAGLFHLAHPFRPNGNARLQLHLSNGVPPKLNFHTCHALVLLMRAKRKEQSQYKEQGRQAGQGRKDQADQDRKEAKER